MRGRALLQGRSCSGASLEETAASTKAGLDWFCVPRSAFRRRCTMSQDKTNAILKEFKEFEAAPGMYSKKKLVSMTLIVGWMSRVVPRARPFVSHLQGAIHATPNGEAVREHRPKALIFKRRVEYAWETPASSRRSLPLRPWSIVADASPFGLGDILFSAELVPQAHRASELRKWDLERFCAQKENPAFQSERKLLALFFSVLVFSDLVSASCCRVSFVSDSKAALGAASRLRSPAALMGALAAEIAGAGKFRHGTCRSEAHPWHEQQIRRRSVEAQ